MSDLRSRLSKFRTSLILPIEKYSESFVPPCTSDDPSPW